MGISEDLKICNCWRCGVHSTVDTFKRLLNLPYPEIRKLLDEYSENSIGVRKRIPEPKVSINPFKFPEPNFPLNKYGKKYLSKRGFDPEYLEQEWGLKQTAPISFLDGIQYSHRILIPIRWGGKVVSFQSRDITGKSDLKYLSCPTRREEKHHKTILYGKQEAWLESKGIIVVEGPADAWRFGPSSAATFGTSFMMEQVLQLAKHNDRFFIVFDNETNAQKQAKKLMIKLRTLGKYVRIEKVDDDPGSMKQDDANHLVKQLLK